MIIQNFSKLSKVDAGFSKYYGLGFDGNEDDIYTYLYLKTAEKKELRIFSDIHGSEFIWKMLFHGFDNKEWSSGEWKNRIWIFMGDLVDRGTYSMVNLIALLYFRDLFPENFLIIRGNHEDVNQNIRYQLNCNFFITLLVMTNIQNM